jgi:hypothetical protein
MQKQNLRYIDHTKDHQSNDQVTATFFDDPKAAVDVTNQMLAKNVK